MKLAVAVQRYGADINGGAELHARYIAERLARHAERRGRHHLRPRLRDLAQRACRRASRPSTASRCGAFRSTTSGIRRDFGRRSARVFEQPHSIADELAWLKSEGPASRAMVDYLARRAPFDFVILFSYRYYHAYHAARRIPAKAILVPTAERDPAVGLGDLRPGVPGGSRDHVQLARRARDDPGRGRQRRRARRGRRASARRCRTQADAAALPPEVQDRSPVRDLRRPHRREQGLQASCSSYFRRYAATFPARPGPGAGRQRDHAGAASIRASITSASSPTRTSSTRMAAADLLIMPSYFESLSMVALEAWAMGKPVLANGRCDVLKGQCIRSGAGPLLRELRGVRRDAVLARVERSAARAARAQRPRVLPGATTRGRSSSGSTSTCSNGCAQEPPASTIDPLPGWLARRKTRPAGRAPDVLAAAFRRARWWPQHLMSRPSQGRACTRCSRRSGMATPSATRCSASSACCAPPDTCRRSSSRPPIRGSST